MPYFSVSGRIVGHRTALCNWCRHVSQEWNSANHDVRCYLPEDVVETQVLRSLCDLHSVNDAHSWDTPVREVCSKLCGEGGPQFLFLRGAFRTAPRDRSGSRRTAVGYPQPTSVIVQPSS